MALPIDPEAIDLLQLARALRARCGAELPGLLVGKTFLRDEVARQLSCSDLEAETLVDTLVARGFVVRHDRADGTTWTIEGRTAAE